MVRHLSAVERAELAAELTEALSDAAELGLEVTASEVVAGWRATARIKVDKTSEAPDLTTLLQSVI
jgi:hypothetical protein